MFGFGNDNKVQISVGSIRIRMRPLDLGIAATASVPLLRPSFQLRSPGPAVAVFVPAPVVARVVAGIRVMFGRR